MIHLTVVGAAFAAAILGSDLALAGAKVQTRLARVILVYAAVGALLLLYLRWTHVAGTVAFSIYWGGAFLSWFGIRSHIESSILLRMLFLLKNGALSRAELLAAYERHYGAPQRVDELLRAGLLQPGPDGLAATRKGLFIAKAAAWLR